MTTWNQRTSFRWNWECQVSDNTVATPPAKEFGIFKETSSNRHPNIWPVPIVYPIHGSKLSTHNCPTKIKFSESLGTIKMLRKDNVDFEKFPPWLTITVNSRYTYSERFKSTQVRIWSHVIVAGGVKKPWIRNTLNDRKSSICQGRRS